MNGDFLIIAFIGSMIFLGSCSGKTESEIQKKPNIIFIMADDLGIGDVGVYGQEIIKTTNIDRLASEGMKFDNFYAGSTVCAPSRATLLTGQHTGNTAVRGNGEFPLDPKKRIIPELLKKEGYTNAIFGKWGLGLKGSTGSPEIRGWDRFLGLLHHVDAHFQKPDSLDMIRDGIMVKEKIEEGTFSNNLFTEAAVKFIHEQPEEDPFFLYLSFTIPHAELMVPKKYLRKHLDAQGESLHQPEKAQPQGLHYGAQKFPKAAYAALVESIDDYVGMVMLALKKKGIDENTLVIFTSDNGTHMEGGRTREDVQYFRSSGIYKGVKRDLYAGGIKEPFIVRWPSQIEAGSTSDHTAAFWDVYPTFAEIAKISIQDEPIDGISFLPTLKGNKDQKKHEYLYWEFHEFGGKQAVLKGDWKAVRLGVNIYRDAPVELYNIKEDPGEEKNVSGDYKNKTIIESMTRLMNNTRSPNDNFNFPNNPK